MLTREENIGKANTSPSSHHRPIVADTADVVVDVPAAAAGISSTALAAEVLLAAHRGQANQVIALHNQLKRRGGPEGVYDAADAAAALWVAAQSGHATVVNSLLDHCGVDINSQYGARGTALLVSAQNGHYRVMQALLGRGADTELADKDGVTPLFMAAKNTRLRCVMALADAGAVIDAPRRGDGVTPLLMAAQNGHMHVVSELLARGADIDKVCTDDGMSPLYAACRKGRVDVVRVLAESGADLLKKRSSHGETPLHCAAFWGHLGCVEVLGAYGVPLDTVDFDGDTPHSAAKEAGPRGVIVAEWLAAAENHRPLQCEWWGSEGHALRAGTPPWKLKAGMELHGIIQDRWV
jgi:ankyrin repeat protein